MAKDLFTNPHSEIPDELWKTPSPMQRQVDAAVLWAELTGKNREEEERLAEEPEKSASARETLRWVAENPTATGAMLGAPIGAGHMLYGTSKAKGGLSRDEYKLRGQLAALKEEDRHSGKRPSDKKRKKLLARLKRAQWSADNRALSVLGGGALGAGVGAAAGYHAKHQPLQQLVEKLKK